MAQIFITAIAMIGAYYVGLWICEFAKGLLIIFGLRKP